MLVYGRFREGWKKSRMTKLAARLRRRVACQGLKPDRVAPRVEIRRKDGVVTITRLRGLNPEEIGTLYWEAEEEYRDVMGLP